jgi:multidrug efflux pump subunit AcrA (membrane-fusion protein)
MSINHQNTGQNTGPEQNQLAVREESIDIPSTSVPNIDQPSAPKWRRFIFPVGVGLFLLAGLGWVVFNRIILPILMFSQMKPAPPIAVPLRAPKTATVEDSSDYAATLDSRQAIRVQSRVAGQISAIYVQAGDRVTAGQRLLQIDADEQRAQVASRNAAVNTAMAEIDSAQADVANAQDTLQSLQARRESAKANVQLNQEEYKRFQKLYQSGATSKQTLDQRLNAIQTAQAELRQVDADLRAQNSAIARAKAQVARNQRAMQQAQANVAEGRAQLRYYSITAPFSGVVGNVPAKIGDVVDATTQLLTVTQNQRLEVQLQIPLERSSALRRGLPVKLLDEQNRPVRTGQISFISPDVNSETQSVLAKAAFANVGDTLRSAQFVRTRVVWSNRPGLLVPTSAISRLGGKDFIFVAKPFQTSGCKTIAQGEGGGPATSPAKADPNQWVAAQRLIKLGKIVGNEQEVLDGLSGSDRIVTSGILQLQNCLPIAEGKAAL